MNKKQIERNSGFHALLRKAGLKVTLARLSVLSHLEKAESPLTAHEVIDKNKNIDPVTVYRIMNNFKERGIIRPVDLRHNHAHFELVLGAKHHHHIVCEVCGRIEDAENCDPVDLERKVLERSKKFESIKTHAIEFFGICNSCAKKIKI